DIKPQNILFRRDGCPVLVDYGFIYHVTNKAEKSSILASVTDVGEKPSGPGTPLYMSPAADERNYEPSTDIAALGYIFYELLTGRIANIRDEKDSPTKSILLERRKNSMPVPPHDHDAQVPIPLSDLCMEMIGWKDNVRSIPIKNAYQVVDRIEQFLANSKAVTTAPNNNLARTSLFAALSCVALAGVVAYPYMMPRSTPTTVVVGQPTTTELYRAIRNDLRAVPNRPTTTRYIRLDLVPHSYREAVRDSLTSIFGTNIRALQDMPLLLALDLSATGWTNDTWKQVTGDAYPYRMTPGAFPNNGEWADLVNEVQNNLLDRQIPCVRGDWLLDYLSSPVAKELRPKGWNNSADDIAQRYREIQINLEIAGIETGLGAEEFTRRSILIEDRNRLPKAILDVMDGQSINRSDWENSFQKILLPMRIGAIR
ncbi:MAG: hypothetical protein KGQ60_10525, partial [Planctomycetes bacterium]|nr:hypothetical protein [Planctomycetota bacterium]